MSKIPNDVDEAAADFVEAVTLPWGEIEPGLYRFNSPDEIRMFARRAYTIRYTHADTFPHKAKSRIIDVLNRADVTHPDELEPYDLLDFRLYVLAAREASGYDLDIPTF